LCDIFLEGDEEETLVELRIFNKNEKILIRRLKGTVRVDGNEVEKMGRPPGGRPVRGVRKKPLVLKKLTWKKVEKVQIEKKHHRKR